MDARFVGAVARPGQPFPTTLPQVAFAGRSNAGKSSLLNRLVGRKHLARTSKQPGRTQQLNFFEVAGQYALVDLPGYGFARAPGPERRRWARLIRWYLQRDPGPVGLVLLMDSRRDLVDEDRAMVVLLQEIGLPTLFALTKSDKLGRQALDRALAGRRRELGIDADQLLATSSVTGSGVSDLRDSISALAGGPSPTSPKP